MYKVNYLIPTANDKNVPHSYIARTLAEVTHVKAKCKELGYIHISTQKERKYCVDYKHNGYPCVKNVKAFSAEDAGFLVCVTLNNIVDCTVTEMC